MLTEWFLRRFSQYRELERKTEGLEEKLKELDSLAHEDVLTGVWNQNGFKRIVEPVLETMKRQNGYQVREGAIRDLSFVFADLDKFKAVNDRFGHHVGDQLLAQFAQFLKTNVRRVDTVGRWYRGDEFAIALAGVSYPDALRYVQTLKWKSGISSALRIVHPKGTLKITASFGIASVFQDPNKPVFDIAELAKEADCAMYEDKKEKE